MNEQVGVCVGVSRSRTLTDASSPLRKLSGSVVTIFRQEPQKKKVPKTTEVTAPNVTRGSSTFN